jgi:formylglycine-generating enzyme required for sulfatase activity
MKYTLAGMQYQDFSLGRYEDNLMNLVRVLPKVSTGEGRPSVWEEDSIVGGHPTKTRSVGGVEFMLVPKGAFVMGSKEVDELAYEFERPQHIFEIGRDYWITRFLTTNAQFERFAQANPVYRTTAEKRGSGWVYDGIAWNETEGADWRHPCGPQSGIMGKQDHPVVQVSWYDAMTYCAWFNVAYKPELGELEVRLPSETEWEKAARGDYGNTWPWGDVWEARRCNSSEGGKGDTTPVGHYSLFGGDSPYGIADMVGNVYEWTCSLWGKEDDTCAYGYPYDPDDGRENAKAAQDVQRVLRGGSFLNNRKNSRCAFRGADIPYRVAFRIGFRVVACIYDVTR